MKIAINILPLKTGHKNRGIGLYTSNLIENLKKDPRVKVQEFVNIKEVENVDLVHYPYFDFFFHTIPLRKKFKTIITIHDVIPLLFPQHHPSGVKGKINLFLQKLALKDCKNIITDSEVSKNDIARFLKIKKDKISVVHLAASENFHSQSDTKLIYIKRKYKLPERFLLYVGDANWIKNLPFLIEGFNNIRKEADFVNLKLVLVGGVFLKNVEQINHPELESLKKINKMIKDYSIQEFVIKPGDLDLEELISFYNLATIYIQPSLYEGFGLPLLEAFSCGTPVLSSTGGSLKEVGGQAAVYFEPNNLSQFSELLKEILTNKSLRERLSKLGLEQSRKFSWQKVADETKMVYSKVLNNE
jgi:glycosyltransferase involved in cell wall biosynthesis